MNRLRMHLFDEQDDLRRMIDLAQSLRDSGQRVYPNSADLFEELADADAQVSTRLWESENGELAGFAYVSPWQNLVDVFDAGELTSAVETELMRAAAEAMRQRNQAHASQDTLDAVALEDDLARKALLERHGFKREEESSMLYACSLEGSIGEPILPKGFSIRPMGGQSELGKYVALHRAAFGTEHMTEAYRQTIMNAPDYIPELDLVAVAPNGELAAQPPNQGKSRLAR